MAEVQTSDNLPITTDAVPESAPPVVSVPEPAPASIPEAASVVPVVPAEVVEAASTSQSVSENATVNGAENVPVNGAESFNSEEISIDASSVSEKEKELLDMVFSLESEKQSILEESRTRISQLRNDLEESKFENEKLKKKNQQLEQNLKQALTSGIETPKTKKDLDEVLIKAKTLLFEKTKVCKQQEQHIAVLKTQVDSIKEVLNVTKEMINLKNTEAEHSQARMESMDLRIKAEKDKSGLIEKKLDISQKVYEKLRREYDCQTNLFKELKLTYEQKIKMLTDTIEKLKK